MKQIGAEIGVNESRVSQLHARAIKRLRVVLADMAPAEAMSALKSAVLAFHQKPAMAKAALRSVRPSARKRPQRSRRRPGVVVNITPSRSKRYVARAGCSAGGSRRRRSRAVSR